VRSSKFTSPANARVMSGDDVAELLGLGWLVCAAEEDVGVGGVVLQAVGATAAADKPAMSTRLETTRPA
jgi:hypothetical protein